MSIIVDGILFLPSTVILHSRLPPFTRTLYFLRLLADPHRQVKQHTLSVLLNPDMSHGLSHVLLPVVQHLIGADDAKSNSSRKKTLRPTRGSSAVGFGSGALEDLEDGDLLQVLEEVTDAYHRRAGLELLTEQQRHLRRATLGLSNLNPTTRSATATMMNSSPIGDTQPDAMRPLFKIPLDDTDPFNLRWLQSPRYLHLLLKYGMDRPFVDITLLQPHHKDSYAMFQQLSSSASSQHALGPKSDIAPTESEDLPTLITQLTPAKRNDLIAEIRAKQALVATAANENESLAPFIAAVLKQDGGKGGEQLVAELLKGFDSIGDQNGSAASVAVESDPSKSKSATDPLIDLADKSHTLYVVMNLLAGFTHAITGGSGNSNGSQLTPKEKETLQGKLDFSLNELQSSSSRLKHYADQLRTRTLLALDELHAYRGPASGTKWSFHIKNEQTFQRREHYYKTMMMTGHGKGYSEEKTNLSDKGKTSGSPSDSDTVPPNSKQDLLSRVRSLERSVAVMQTQLSHATMLQIKVIQCVVQIVRTPMKGNGESIPNSPSPSSSSMIAAGSSLPSSSFLASFSWLLHQLFDRHRGVRHVIREGMVALCREYCQPFDGSANLSSNTTTRLMSDKSASDPFIQQLQKTVAHLFKALKEPNTLISETASGNGSGVIGSVDSTDSAWFYRRRPRSDLIALLGHLIPYSLNSKLRVDVIPLLIQFWDDTDSTVRIVAIEMIQYLVRSNYSEIMQLVKSKDSSKSTPLMKEILQRVRDPEYGEKEKLNQLLNWYFIQQQP